MTQSQQNLSEPGRCPLHADTAAAGSSHSGALQGSARQCPVPHAFARTLAADDELVLPKRRRFSSSYSEETPGVRELHIYSGDKEVVFDEPDLFCFGETLLEQTEFRACEAMAWGDQPWSRIQPLLEALIGEGLLKYRTSAEQPRKEGVVPSPLPQAESPIARTWLECEQLTLEIGGRAVELGYLELVVPIYRIVHPMLDQDGRQVGEANVFPASLRLDIATEWRACQYPGSRYQDEFPMNVSALKAMTRHWKPMMGVLALLRRQYLAYFRSCHGRLTLGDVERLCNIALVLPTYLAMRTRHPLQNGELSPVLSSLFRVTDGLRLTAHTRMVPIVNGTPPQAPATAATAAGLYDHAEQSAGFLSTHGVCAGPRAMIDEFIQVVVDGKQVEGADSVALDAQVEGVLNELPEVFEYGLRGLQAYVVSQALFSIVARAYESVSELLQTSASAAPDTLDPSAADGRGLRRERFRARIARRMKQLLLGTFLGREEDRAAYYRLHEDSYEQAELALSGRLSSQARDLQPSERFQSLLTPRPCATARTALDTLRVLLTRRFGAGQLSAELPGRLLDGFQREQAIVRAAERVQARINAVLERPTPRRPLESRDLKVSPLLAGPERVIPDLVEDLAEELRIRVEIESERIAIIDLESA